MSEGNAFKDLIGRIRAGDEDAAAELVRIYEPAIRRAARIRLVDSRLRRIFDSMDICQSVFASFFLRAALGQYELDKPERLMNLLVNMSRKKLADHARLERAARRDYRRVRTGREEEKNLAAADSSPSQVAATRELIDEYRKRFTPEERHLADQRALGRDWAEIAKECGGTADALRKRLTRAVERIGRELGLDEFDHD